MKQTYTKWFFFLEQSSVSVEHITIYNQLEQTVCKGKAWFLAFGREDNLKKMYELVKQRDIAPAPSLEVSSGGSPTAAIDSSVVAKGS